MTPSPEVPCINPEMGVSCGPSRNGGAFGEDVPAVWATIRHRGENKTAMLSVVAAIQFG